MLGGGGGERGGGEEERRRGGEEGRREESIGERWIEEGGRDTAKHRESQL